MGEAIDWYLVRTPPAREPAAAHVLKSTGYHCYSPMRVVWRRHRHQLEKRQLALFPSYVFVGLDETTPDGEVLRDLPFVAALVSIDGINPARIRRAVVEELKVRFGELTTGPRFHRWIAGKPFDIGDWVELIGEVTPAMRGIAFRVEEIRGARAVLFTLGARIVARLDSLQARA